MSKIKVKTHLHGPDTNSVVESLGIVHDQKLFYQENDIKVIVTRQGGNVTLERIHQQYHLTLNFSDQQTTMGRYQLQHYAGEIPLYITTYRLQVSDQKLEIDYHLTIGEEDRGHFTFLLEYEVNV